MPIPSYFNIKPTAKTIRTDEPLKGNNSEWMVWWYCGIYKNHLANKQPNVLVAFREIIDGNISDKVIMKTAQLTALGQLTVGSIWKDGVCRAAADFTVRDFEVDFRVEGWRFTSFGDAGDRGVEPPYPRNLHKLAYPADKNWLIEFKLISGGKLVVPCLEFFSRCYGRSQELNRVLATYLWEGSHDSCVNRFYAPIDEPEEPDKKWKVKLRMRLRNGDTTFLAHVKYDKYTKERAQSIHSQITTQYDSSTNPLIFINAAPWFQGPAKIKVRGLAFDGGRSFLGLQVIGCSDPDGILILRDRDNSTLREGVGSGEAWANAPPMKLIRPPDIIDLTGDLEPDHGSSNVEILDQDFEILGIPRMIVDRHGKKVTDKRGHQRKGEDASSYSSGEPHGTGKGVGYASIHAKPVMESHGVLIDMWNAALFNKETYPENIQSVEWFTFEDGYKSIGPPRLIAIEPFDDDEKECLPTKTKNWLFHNVETAQIRGVMVLRLKIKGIPVHIIELQRRPKKVTGENDQKKEAEESYKGFVTIIENDDQFIIWLKRFLSDVRYVHGIVQGLIPCNPGKADVFAHRPASAQRVPYEKVVLNALGKVGIQL